MHRTINFCSHPDANYLIASSSSKGFLRVRYYSRGANSDHVVVSPDGDSFHGVTDAALDELGVTRRIALSVPHFLLLI